MKKLPVYFYLIPMLMVASMLSWAQDGQTPYAGSTHRYRIAPEKLSNVLTWSVEEPAGYSINTQEVEGTNSMVNITWLTAGTYTLRFTETDPGSGCVSARELEVVVSESQFNVTVSSPAVTCNAADGVVNFADNKVVTPIYFEVNSTTGNEHFNPGWEFTFSLSSASGAFIEKVTAGAAVIPPEAGTYTVTGLTSSSGRGAVSLRVEVTGEVYSEETVTLQLISANELEYNAPASAGGNLTATQVIHAVPQTSDILTD